MPTPRLSLVAALVLLAASHLAFASVARADSDVPDDWRLDPAIAGLVAPLEQAARIAGQASAFSPRALLTTLEENLRMIGDSVAHLKGHGRRVVFDAEHFFDGYKANPDYALACVRAASEAGADSIDLCETNGGALPHEVGEIVARRHGYHFRVFDREPLAWLWLRYGRE